ncbi:MAG: fumarate reductase (CoM/CoB) subunit [Bacillota bacterium]|nr:fumarate reductase (CoM/CoB) subunit [Bacillota bacterium]
MVWDVVVVGGGAAALSAALAGAKEGAKVLVLAKTALGLGNSSAVSGGGFTLGVGGFPPDKHRENTLKTGRWVNDPVLVDVLVSEGPDAVLGLTEYGVKLDVGKGLASVAKYARREVIAGTAFTLPLAKAVKDRGVAVHERAMVTELLVSSGRCVGLAYLDLTSGRVEEVPARAVVVATGGAGQLYARTDNPPGTTGDGYALLYHAGATLKDMEFVQFFPLGFADPELPGWFIPLSLADEVPLTNDRGEEFLRKKLPEWGLSTMAGAERYARDRAAQAVAREMAAGRTVYLHLNRLPEERWQGTLVADLKRIASKRINLREEPVAVAPTQHFFCGGVVIGPWGETDIPGVFACGEVAAGIHGANRVGGNALTEAVVFGRRAGQAAARYAKENARTPSLPVPRQTEERLKRWQEGRGTSPRELKRRLNGVAGTYLGVLRSGKGLAAAIRELEELAAEAREVKAEAPREIREAFEAENLILTGLMVAHSALLREESRGTHYREDFPAEGGPAWQCNIRIHRGEDGCPRCEKGPQACSARARM